MEESLSNTFERIISATIEQGSILLQSEEFLENRKQCSVAIAITCKVDNRGKNCDELVVPYNECGYEDMTFTFEYCNDDFNIIKLFGGRTENVDMKNLPKGTMAYINSKSVDINLGDMVPGKCWTVQESRKVNTCWKTINASLKIEGWRGDGNIGDYCYAWSFYRYIIKRPLLPRPTSPCAISGAVTCIVQETGQNCNDLIVPLDRCRKQDMVFTFEYCNNESDLLIHIREGDAYADDIDMKNLPPGTMAFIHSTPVDINVKDLFPGECRKIVENQAVDTCWNNIDASLKVEGWRGGADDYCYLWDFYRSKIKRPPAACEASTKVTCSIDSTGEACEDFTVPQKDCGPEAMTFTFEYCNNDARDFISLMKGNTRGDVDMNNLPPGTMAFIHTSPVEINLKDLPPGRCRKVIETRLVDTCWETIDASLKVEGWRGDGGKGNFCYSWDFYRSKIRRPEPCKASTNVSCVVDRTGEACEQLVIPEKDCGPEAMTFTFEYCNNNARDFISLMKGNNRGDIDMKDLPPGTMAFIHTSPVDTNLKDLPPGRCRKIVETRLVDTCWETIDASLKVEGWRGDGGKGNFCYSWDFYRSHIRRTPSVPTQSPSTTFQPCQVSSKVSCSIDRTGQPCEAFIAPLSQCGEESLTFSYQYCNNERLNYIELIEGDTRGNLDMKNLPKGTMAFVYKRPVTLDLQEMRPGECRIIKFQRNISTCRPTIDASLKIEGWRGNAKGDYCYAWDFYRTNIAREEFIPTKSPTSKCDVTAEVSCVVDQTGQNCGNLVVPLDDCGREEMTFTFEYCNTEVFEDVMLIEGNASGNIDMRNLPKGTMAFIHKDPVKLDTFYLPPRSCQSVVVTKAVSTCRSFIDASLKLEGWRGDGGAGNFCYAWNFYRSPMKRDGFPTPSPTKISIDSSSNPSGIPKTITPTISSQPTVDFCGLPKDVQRARITSIINSVSSKSILENPNSPQSRARNWILFEDTFDSFCPPPCNRDRTDGGVIQRYTMAVFYFATGGDRTWLSCGRNSPEVCDPQLTLFQGDPIDIITGKETWLEPVSECVWGGLSCRADTQCLDRIEFGKMDVIMSSSNTSHPFHY